MTFKFKIGDEVIVGNASDLGSTLFEEGAKHTITHLVSTVPYGGFGAIYRLDNMDLYGAVFEKGLTLAPKELKCEVGKKYKSKATGRIFTCLAVAGNDAWMEYELYGKTMHGTFIANNFEEYVPPPPPPVKKEGWIRLYPTSPSNTSPGRLKETSLVFATEEQARTPSHYNQRTDFIVTKVEWEEPGKPEDADGDEI